MIEALASLTTRIDGVGTPAVDRAASAGTRAAAGTSLPSFGEMFEQVSRNAIGSLQNAEAVSVSALQGQASALQVVEAIKSAENALQTATAVRDKIVQAYQEISRMAI